jgi:FAD/FMN-containing dehydrogenase
MPATARDDAAMESERKVSVSERRFVLQVGGHARAADTDLVNHVDRVGVSTQFQLRVRDQAALHGLLRRIFDLGLTLLEVQVAPHGIVPDGDVHAQIPVTGEREYKVAVSGAVDGFIEDTLGDHGDVLHVSTQYVFTDPLTMGAVLTRLLDRGAEIELAHD